MGRVYKIGDNIDTDQLAPTAYVLSSDIKEISSHCLERIRPDIPARIKPGDVLVAGRNMGCGSSRERAAVAVKGLEVACVIAASYARLFYRNAINIGLPILECPEAAAALEEGDEVSVNLDTGEITRSADGRVFQAQAFPPFVQEIIGSGGLVPYALRLLKERERGQ